MNGLRPAGLDPQQAAVLDELDELDAALPEPEDPAQALIAARNGYMERSHRLTGELAPVDEVADLDIPGEAGPLPVRVYTPGGPVPAGGRGLVLFCHGGGFVVGSRDSHDGLARALADASGAVLASVEYRLAPEQRFPAAVEDAWTALGWIAERGEAFGAVAGRVAVAGDSAGGNLAAVLARRCRDRSGPELALQAMAYPCLDASLSSASMHELGDGLGLTREDMERFWSLYLGEDGDPSDPEVSPLAAEDLAGLAPAWILTAEFDPLRDEGERYARALADAGVAVESVRCPGAVHGFLRWRAAVDAARRRTAQMAAALGTALHGA